jgi:transcription elongation factor Elf1
MPAAGSGTPTCPKCNSTEVEMTLKTASGAYYRCGNCGHMWHTDKPQPRARA